MAGVLKDAGQAGSDGTLRVEDAGRKVAGNEAG